MVDPFLTRVSKAGLDNRFGLLKTLTDDEKNYLSDGYEFRILQCNNHRITISVLEVISTAWTLADVSERCCIGPL